jgi:hypothetical protein
MGWLSELGRRLWMLMRRRQFDADLEEEMRLHLELREQEQEQAGLAPSDARHAALRRFGDATALKEKSHLAWGWEWFEHLMQDVNYGVRCCGVRASRLWLSLACSGHWHEYCDLQPDGRRDAAVSASEGAGGLVLFGDETWSGVSDAFPINQLLFLSALSRDAEEEPGVLGRCCSLQHDEPRAWIAFLRDGK